MEDVFYHARDLPSRIICTNYLPEHGIKFSRVSKLMVSIPVFVEYKAGYAHFSAIPLKSSQYELRDGDGEIEYKPIERSDFDILTCVFLLQHVFG